MVYGSSWLFKKINLQYIQGQLNKYKNMQEEIKSIIRRFKDHDYCSDIISNKQNFNQFQKLPKKVTQQDLNTLHSQLKKMENIIEALITDANSAFRYFQDIINEYTDQYDALKDQFIVFKQITASEKLESETLLQDYRKKIQRLSQEIIHKEYFNRDIIERFEEFEQKNIEVRGEERESYEHYREQLIRSSAKFEEKITSVSNELAKLKQKLSEVEQRNENLIEQNRYLTSINEELLENIQNLEFKICESRNIQSVSRIKRYNQFDQCGVESIECTQERFTLQEIKLNQSNEINFGTEKEILNISEHYSKLNLTRELYSKEKQIHDENLTIMDSVEGKSFIKKRDTVLQIKNNNFKIDTIESKQQQKPSVKSSHAEIVEVKEFQMQDNRSSGQAVDPYYAFFLLLTQCEKLNSSIFEKISHIDITDIYDGLIKMKIPYNKWQVRIKQAIEKKAGRKIN